MNKCKWVISVQNAGVFDTVYDTDCGAWYVRWDISDNNICPNCGRKIELETTN